MNQQDRTVLEILERPSTCFDLLDKTHGVLSEDDLALLTMDLDAMDDARRARSRKESDRLELASQSSARSLSRLGIA